MEACTCGSPFQKKGSIELPENYRPISLLDVGYKVMAAIILQRLQTGGAEERIRESQYGFRPKRSSSDALFLARQIIDATLSNKDQKLSMIALDWEKAFDRINPEALMIALSRFGLPHAIIEMIQGIYQDRTFQVFEDGERSNSYSQSSGIAQGCPLSLYLFIILISALLEDIDRSVLPFHDDSVYIHTNDILSADDTLILSSDRNHAQALLNTIVHVGKYYGL